MQDLYDLSIKLLDMLDHSRPHSERWCKVRAQIYDRIHRRHFLAYTGKLIDFETDHRALTEWNIDIHVSTIETSLGDPVTKWHAIACLRYWTKQLRLLIDGRVPDDR